MEESVRKCQPVAFLALLVLSLPAYTQSQSNDKRGTAGVEQQLKELDRKWLDSARDGDAEFLRGLFVDKMFEINSNGQIVPFDAEMLRRVGSRKNTATRGGSTVDEIEVMGIYGNVAILTDRRTIKDMGTANPNGAYRAMRVYVKMGGKWRAVGAQLTRIQPVSTVNQQ
jgi:hypothetical protein